MINVDDLTDGQKHEILKNIYGCDNLGRFGYIWVFSGERGKCPFGPSVGQKDLSMFLASGHILPDETVEAPPIAKCTGPCNDCDNEKEIVNEP